MEGSELLDVREIHTTSRIRCILIPPPQKVANGGAERETWKFFSIQSMLNHLVVPLVKDYSKDAKSVVSSFLNCERLSDMALLRHT